MLFLGTIRKSERSDKYEMLFLGIITIQILQVTVISGDWPLVKFTYISKYSIPTKTESGISPLDLRDLLIVKNSIVSLITIRNLQVNFSLSMKGNFSLL